MKNHVFQENIVSMSSELETVVYREKYNQRGKEKYKFT